MRTLLVLLLLILGATGAAWIGGESWLAREVDRRIADDPQVEVASVTPLRQIDRIGLKLSDLSVKTADGTVSLPMLDLWAAPTSPTEFHASLPAEMTLPLAGVPHKLGTQGADMSVRLSPGSGMSISRAIAASGPVTLDGATVAERAEFEARLTALGASSPPGAKASYIALAKIAGLTPENLGNLTSTLPPALVNAGPIAIDGTAKLFLTGALVPGQDTPPHLVGLSSDGVTLSLSALKARIAGQLAPDDQGRAQGAVFVYTTDPRGWLALAGAAGLIPENIVPLAGTALETAAGAEIDLPPGIAPPAAPQDKELRIPLIFKDGRSFLGPLPMGPAPIFPG